MTDSVGNLLKSAQERVVAALHQRLPRAEINPARLHEGMRYATLPGGKRVRAALVYYAGEAVGAPLTQLDGPAAAMECVHAYSLVHDDLPAMDDDDLRRGNPTCHIKYDEATAILIGDALHDLAFEILACDPGMAVSGDIRVRMIALLANSAGSRGMAGGQMMDIEAVDQELGVAQLENMHIHKTGALIRTATQFGLLGAGVTDRDLLKKIDHYGKCIGLAFQIQDDVLDATANTATLGKTSGADEMLNKPTYVSLMGLDQARREAQMLCDEALESLQILGDNGEKLRAIANYIIERPY